MNAGSMDALIGANASIRITEVPMKAYREAKIKGDTDAMERALGYAGKFTEKAADYSEKASAETLKEQRAEAKAQKARRGEAIEKAREERKSAEQAEPADKAEISGGGRAAMEKSAAEIKPAVSGKKETYNADGTTVPLEQTAVSLEGTA